MALTAEDDLAPRPGSLSDGFLRMGDFWRPSVGNSLADDLASHYSGVSEDDSLDRGAREAAMLFCVAEGHLSEGEAEEALKAAEDALALFRQRGDLTGVADTLRIVIGAHRMKGLTAQATEVAMKELEGFKSTKNSRGEAAMRLAAAEVLLEESKPEEASTPLKEALEIFQRLEDKKMQATAQLALASVHAMSDNPQDATDAAKTAVFLCIEAGDKKAEAKAWHALANMHLMYESPEEGFQAAQKSMACCEETEDEKGQAMALNCMALAQLELEDPEEAQRYANEASAVSRRIGYAKGEVDSVQTLVNIQTERGDRQEALSVAKEGVVWCQKNGSKRVEASALEVLVAAHLSNREAEEALRACWEAMEILRDLGDRRAHSASLIKVSMLHLVNSQEDWAMESVQEAAEIFKELEDVKGEASAQFTLVHVHLQKMETKDALAAANRAERLFKTACDKRAMATTLLTAVRVHRANGDSKYAAASAQRAMGYFEEAADRRGAASASLAMAEVHFETQSFERALKASRRAQAMLEKVGHVRSQAVALHMVAGACLSADMPEDAVKYSQEMRNLCKQVQDKKGEGHAMYLLTRANIGQIFKEAEKLEKYRPKDVVENDDEEREVKMSYGLPGVSTDKREQPVMQDPRYEKAVAQHARIMEAADRALTVAKESVAVAKRSDDKELQSMTLYSLAQVQLLAGKADEAQKSVQEAIDLSKASGEKNCEALSLVLSAEIHIMNQRTGDAVDAAERGLRLCKKIGDWAGEDYAKRVLEHILGEPAPGMDDDAGDAAAASGGEVAVFQGLDPAFVRAELRDQVSQLVGLDDDSMGDDTPLMDSGMDSLSSVEFRNTVAKEFKMNLPATLTFDFPSIKSLTEFIVEQSRAESEGAGGGGGGGGGGRSTAKSGIAGGGKGGGGAAAKSLSKKAVRPCISGTWDNWGVHEMTYDPKGKCYEVSVRVGRNGWESFQILYDGDWTKCIYPDKKDACPHEPHKVCGPDEDGSGKNWTVGLHATDKSAEGVCFQIKLMLQDDGIAEKVDWVRLGTNSPDVLPASMAKAKAAPKYLPYIVGTMNNWGEPSVMTWDADGGYFRYRLTVGKQGWESFQILFNGEWRRCLHPDKKDGCPHSHYQLMGPDDEGDGKNWTIGRHPLDKGGEGKTYLIRLFLRGGQEGIPRSVDWVRG